MRHYDIGATPLREGLSRLVSRGLIVAIGQRGFRVASVSREDLADITRMRVVVEVEALRLAMAKGGDAWEANILSALHQLRRHIERVGIKFREGAEDFDALHKSFHTSLLQACGSMRLLAAHSDLYDQAYRYRRLMMRGFDSGERFAEVHRELAERVIARDAAKAQAMLAEHLGIDACSTSTPTMKGRWSLEVLPGSSRTPGTASIVDSGVRNDVSGSHLLPA